MGRYRLSPLARLGGLTSWLLLAATSSLPGCAGAMNAMPALPGSAAADEVEDDQARKAHFEEAAQTYYDGARYEQAVMQWRKVLAIEPDRPKANWGLAKSLAMIGTPPSLRESEMIFEKIKDWDWTHPTLGDRRFEVLKDFAEVYSQLADYYDRDIRILDDKLQQSDPIETARLREQKQTQVAARNALLSKAIPLYQEVLALNPGNPYAIAGLAKCHLMVGHDQRGLMFARQYLQLTQTSQVGWQAQYEALEKERQREATQEQRDYFKGKIRTAREKELKMHLLIASVLMKIRDYPSAIKEYDDVLKLDPARPAAYVERGQAYGKMGNYKQAVSDLEEYLKITDPVKQRNARLQAAELLEDYRLKQAEQRAPALGNPTGPGYPPPPPPPTPLGAPNQR
jgi:tetratricopeptide (TPR) repeat protein